MRASSTPSLPFGVVVTEYPTLVKDLSIAARRKRLSSITRMLIVSLPFGAYFSRTRSLFLLHMHSMYLPPSLINWNLCLFQFCKLNSEPALEQLELIGGHE